MANNSIKGLPVYPWNPFNDMTINEIKGEIVNVQPTPGGSIIIPRCAPFFTREVKIRLRGSNRELDMKKGEFSFLYPFGDFISTYSQLVYSGIIIHNVTEPANFEIDYNTIGSDFVLDDIAYAQAVANTLTAPRRADWSDLVNLPPAWPADPHDHPASDTFNYNDMIVSIHSYIDAMTGSNNPESIQSAFEEHLKAELQSAHKAKLSDLGIKNLQDWAMAKTEDISGNSDQLLVNVNVLKAAIRSYKNGWE
ncbi:virion structural protein [Aeromonas phage D3]|uniref:Tail fiber protein n=1 Tax=Aeromonas phage D3 TaxID=2593327 RepID=A0A514TVR1_9CAUD|nr:virion structural protein [Aeromonas phage D3]QDJ97115.1 hypothetical protein D3_0117 [Aeromonas phage D3]